jgi:hypothetical protein
MDEASEVLRMVPDLRLAEAMLKGSAFLPVERMRGEREMGQAGPLDEAAEAAGQVMAMLREVVAGMSKGGLSEGERACIEDHAGQVEAALARLRYRLALHATLYPAEGEPGPSLSMASPRAGR